MFIKEALLKVSGRPKAEVDLELTALRLGVPVKELNQDVRYGIARHFFDQFEKKHSQPYAFNGDFVFLSSIHEKFGPDIWARLIKEGHVQIHVRNLEEYIQGLEEDAQKEGWAK